VVASAKKFQEDGLRKMIEYNISLSHPDNPNPDHKTKYPNECDAKNVNRLKDIEKRVTHEHELRLEVNKVRLLKKTGPRRTEA